MKTKDVGWPSDSSSVCQNWDQRTKTSHCSLQSLREGTDPAETWVFEDGLYAIKTASKAGYKTVAVYDEQSSPDWEEMKTLADKHVKNLTEFSI